MNSRVTKINGAIHQIFNEKEVLKATIEKQNSTIDIIQNKSPIKNVLTNSAASDAIKKLNDNLKIKSKELVDARNRNKKLADEIAELQNEKNGDKTSDVDKCVKLTKVVSTKSKEIAELKNENKVMKEKSEEYLKKMNEASDKATALEVKNTRLENQVENLIEAVSKTKSN